MSSSPSLTPQMIEDIATRLESGRPVRRALPGGGRLSIERCLPFLVVYRKRTGRDAGTDRLVVGTASYLIVSGDPARFEEATALISRVAEVMVAAFGSFLIIEVWSGAQATGDDPDDVPVYRIHRRSRHRLDDVTDEMAAALGQSRILGTTPEVFVDGVARVAPRGMRQLVGSRAVGNSGVELLGLEVGPVYRSENGDAYPAVLRQMRRRLTVVFDRAAYRFTEVHTTARPRTHQALRSRPFTRTAASIDTELSVIKESYDVLLQVTPVNIEEQWSEFKGRRFRRTPDFRYRPLPFDPGRMKHRLWAVRPETVEDPTLMYLFRDVQRQTDRELSLLSEVGRPEFLHTSLQLHGGVEAGLLGLARQLLETLPAGRSAEDGELDAEQLADLVRGELREYRAEVPGFGSMPRIRDDLYAGLLVSHGHLMIGARTTVPATRADALIQHELSTHVVTWHNGRRQPMKLLSVGLPGYDEIQEGLGVFAEYLVGGLDAERLRTLAARVLGVHALTDGAEFIDTFRLLRDCGLSEHAAFTVTTRAYRGGGLTKDAMYLRGFSAILDYAAEGLDLANLLVGKYAMKHVSVIEELLFREVLLQPEVIPRYLQRADARARLDKVRAGLSITDIAKDSARR